MGDTTKIEWCDKTFNPWVGCTKISTGPQGACEHCYAESWAKRVGRGNLWQGNRVRTTAENWRKVDRWDRDAAHWVECSGCGRRGDSRTWAADLKKDSPTALACCPDNKPQPTRVRVFCASLADVFDNEVPVEWRRDLFEVIGRTQHLDWLLLTKRIGNAYEMLNDAVDHLSHGINTWDELPWPNVWLGATVATQDEVDRDVPKLLRTPARLRFLSMEPLLGGVDLTPHLWGRTRACDACPRDADCECGLFPRIELEGEPAIHWAIVGGESGGGARGMDLEWAETIVRDCRAAGVAPFVKQLGARPYLSPGPITWPILHHKGGDMREWPEKLKVREFPRPVTT